VDDLSKVFHESEIRTHRICETGQLAQLRYQSHLIASFAILVDQKRLVWIADVLIVPGFVVLCVADLSALLVKGSLWTHVEVDAVDPVCLLVVLCDNS
jgi:hypothetical protein